MSLDSMYDYIYKFIVVGDSNTGKSALTVQFCEQRFTPYQSMTIGVEYSSKFIERPDEYIKIQLWDTAGQEKYQALTRSYYKNVSGVLLVYDTTNILSFNNLDMWLSKIKEQCPPNVVITLVGNKTDKMNRRSVSYEMGKNYAADNGLLFFETSATDYESINCCVEKTCDLITNLINNKEIDINDERNGIKLKVKANNKPQKYNNCCTIQ